MLHGQTDTLTGQLLRSSLELLQLELGTTQSVLSLPWHPWHVLATPGWLKHTWRDLQHYGFQVQDRLERPHHPGSTAAQPLMDVVIQHGFSPHVLKAFNICRQYLHVFWVTDLLTASGTRLDPHLWKGVQSCSHRSTLGWPTHGRPTKLSLIHI